MSDCLTATNGAAQVRKLQRALYRTSKQDKTKRFYSLYDKVWRVDGFPGASEKFCTLARPASWERGHAWGCSAHGVSAARLPRAT